MASQTLLGKSNQDDPVWVRLRSSKWFLAATVGGALFTVSLVERYGLNPILTRYLGRLRLRNGGHSSKS